MKKRIKTKDKDRKEEVVDWTGGGRDDEVGPLKIKTKREDL